MTDDNSAHFAEMMHQLLVPLAQAMVAHGMTIATATEAIKQALVTAAEGQDGRADSDSRISLLTGLNRKEVKRLRHAPAPSVGRTKVNAAAAVISHWRLAKPFCKTVGKPRDLARKGVGGFDDLIRAARVDVPPATVLEMLLEQGAVAALADGDFRLIAASALPQGGAGAIDAFAVTIGAHLTAAVGNLTGTAAPHFDRAVVYSHLTDDDLAVLEAAARVEAQAALERVNALAHALREASAPKRGAKGRFVMGAYVLATPGKGKGPK
ncbi:hypothetical protein SAMN05216227_101569 [Pseudorhodobacter antarcticus]|jgi:hypothetical protein|uniref:Uncharacterized protein n=1 Tax=Pseudorhodobacter antarcticus TaxID=1077947 RepID=A0A1H8GZT8_9RHOB|nr:DUF6502 family protein [Pseudorhodobacter antarcticus]SEN49513.1 hypothetical protein SAMN05216227_101569 [Pseudorhodobacter antarcticus]